MLYSEEPEQRSQFDNGFEQHKYPEVQYSCPKSKHEQCIFQKQQNSRKWWLVSDEESTVSVGLVNGDRHEINGGAKKSGKRKTEIHCIYS